MNCDDVTKIPELKEVLLLRAGAGGMKNIVRWIYFADCLQCVQSEYKIEDYIHGGEFVILTNRAVTDNSEELIRLVHRMLRYDIAALGINEGQISAELIEFADKNNLPLFELPEKYPLIDLSQLICQRLVLEENNKNLEEQLFSSILDSEHLNRESVLAQAGYLNIDLTGRFYVIEFAIKMKQNKNGDSFTSGRKLRHIINAEFSFYIKSDILLLLQTGSVLALVPAGKLKEEQLHTILQRIIDRADKQQNISVDIGIGNAAEYLEDVKESRKEASAAIRNSAITGMDNHIYWYRRQGIYALISKIQDDKFLDEYIDKQIGSLIRADAISRGNLCYTLESYLNNNCNVKDTAHALYIHRNTMNYRLNKIKEILGEDFESLDRCLMIKLAFLIKRYRGR